MFWCSKIYLYSEVWTKLSWTYWRILVYKMYAMNLLKQTGMTFEISRLFFQPVFSFERSTVWPKYIYWSKLVSPLCTTEINWYDSLRESYQFISVVPIKWWIEKVLKHKAHWNWESRWVVNLQNNYLICKRLNMP